MYYLEGETWPAQQAENGRGRSHLLSITPYPGEMRRGHRAARGPRSSATGRDLSPRDLVPHPWGRDRVRQDRATYRLATWCRELEHTWFVTTAGMRMLRTI